MNKICNSLFTFAFYPVKCISILIKKQIYYFVTLIWNKSYTHNDNYDNEYLNNKYKKDNDKTDSDFIIL